MRTDIVRNVAAEMLNTSMQEITAERIHGWATRLGDAATCKDSLQVGNAAAMREAYEFAEEFLRDYGADWELHNKLCDMLKSALSAPARNCDVGTAKEQEERYFKLKREHVDKLLRCPAVGPSFFPDSLYWAQMPYEEVRDAD